jgi:CubicO group peptidase (beta-lactamase class C family)
MCARSRLRNTVTLVAIAAVVPAFAWAGVTRQGNFRVEYKGDSIGNFPQIDSAIESWMSANGVHCAQFAFRQNGTLMLSHAYTMDSNTPLVTTNNTFRLASISKMVVTAAFSQLLSEGKLTGGEPVYKYLGITQPLLPSQTPDKRSKDIISLELAEHTSGLPGEGAGDPLFEMRDIEVALGQEPLTATQFAQYLYGIPLASQPGFVANYSNVGYLLLSQVIAKAAKTDYFSYVTEKLFKPLHLTNWTLSPTLQSQADPNEVAPDDSYTGPDVFDISQNAPLEPFNYEGGDIIWELTAGPTDLVTNAESVSSFIHTWNVYGLGGRAIDYARDGCMPGASTWAESLTTDVDFSVLFSGGACLGFDSAVINTIRSTLSSY